MPTHTGTGGRLHGTNICIALVPCNTKYFILKLFNRERKLHLIYIAYLCEKNSLTTRREMNMFSTQKATTADIPLVHRLAWQAFPATYRDILSEEQITYMMEWMYSPQNLRKQMEEEGHIYYLGYKEGEPIGYFSVQPQGKTLFEGEELDTFHLQKLYVLPAYQGIHFGSYLFKEAIRLIKELHPSPCLMELNVNRHNSQALRFYRHMKMKTITEGDFHIGNGYYMNDYIMGIKI